MKKFLTVLLVIAVMFTFSFGSAFAGATPADGSYLTADQARQAIETEYNALIKAMDSALNAQLATYFAGSTTNNDTLISGIDVDKAVAEEIMKTVILKGYKDVVDDEYDAIQRAVENAIRHDDFLKFTTDTTYTGDTNVYPILQKYEFVATTPGSETYGGTKTGTAVDVSTYVGATGYAITASDVLDKLAVAQFKADLAAAEDAINAINVNDYSDKKMPGSEYTYREEAQKTITDALRTLANITVPTNDDTIGTDIGYIDAVYVEAADSESKPTGWLYEGGTVGTERYVGLNNLLKVANESTAAADLEYARTETLNTILSALANDKAAAVKRINDQLRTEQSKAKVDADKIKELNEGIEDVNDAYEAAVEVITYVVNNVETVEALGTITTATNLFDAGWSYAPGTYTGLATGAAVYAEFKTGVVNINGTKATANELKDGTTPLNALTVAECEDRANDVADAKKAAEKAKIEVELDGSMAVEIEDALAKAIDDIYFTGVGTFIPPTNTTVVLTRINALIGADDATVKVNGKTYPTILDWYAEAGSTAVVGGSYPYAVSSVTSDYDEAMFDEIRAIVKETKAAVKAATTVEEANNAFLAGYAKFDAIPNADEHEAMFTTKAGALKADYDKYVLLLTQLASGIELNSPSTITWIDTNDLTRYVTAVADDMRAECFTAEELKAAYDEAVATLSALKADKDLEAEQAAVEKQLRALPKVVTVADKAAVEAAREAYDAFNDYVTAVGAVVEYPITAYATGLLENAEETIFDLEKEALIDELKPLAKKVVADTLTAADADAIKALRTKVDAFVASYTLEDDANKRIDDLEALITSNGKTLADVETALNIVIVEDLVDMIAKLSVDPVDADAVKAARAAFDALTANGQANFKLNERTSYDKLVALEKALVMDDEAAKAYVQDLSIKARSTKTSKGVKVTIKADVQELLDNGYTVEYKFYRSTKSNKNYGTAKITKTENTYLNTSGKKGTKYYYKAKLVVKNAEGEVVATTPLTQCLYATRTF